MIRARLLFLACLCGCHDATGVPIEVATRVTPLDQLTFSVYTAHGAVVIDQALPPSGAPVLPGRVELDAPGRAESLRVFAWGWRGGARVAFGAVTVAVPAATASQLTLDVVPPDRDGDGVPDALDGCPGVPDPTQADADGDGITDACAGDGGVAPTCAGNLVANAGFEDGTAGWDADSGTLGRVAGGHASAFAARACKTAGKSFYNINDSPPTVMSPMQAARYRLDGWIRVDDMAAQTIHPTIREYDTGGSIVVSSNTGTITPTTDWQLVSTTFQVTQAGSASVQIDFTALDAADGACFFLDDVCFVALP